MVKAAGEYEVGYGKPPKDRQWPKGTSGNPRGREKGHKGIETDLETALNAVQTLENKLTGKRVKGRNQWHAVLRLVERAALGDIKAQALLFPMILQVLGTEDRHYGPKKLSAQDQAILAEVLGQASETADDEVELQPQTGGSGSRMLPPPAAPAVDDDLEREEGEDGHED